MDYNEFTDTIVALLESEICDGVSIAKSDIIKNNGLVRQGITFREKDINASPTIYLEEYYSLYKNGMELCEITDDILGCFYNKRLTQNINLDFFMEYDRVREHLYCKLINKEMNLMLLQVVPHEDFMDMAIVVYYKLDDFNMGDASILIKNEHLKNWNVCSRTIIQDAKNNTRSNMEMITADISAIINEACGADKSCPMFDENDCSIQVVSNKDRFLGAVFLIFEDVLDKFTERFESDIIILPSSIHEFLFLPKREDDDIEMYDAMVRSVNAENVGIEERLSDHAYLYRRIGGFSV